MASHNSIADAFEAGVRAGSDKAAQVKAAYRPDPVHDVLRDVVAPGDLIIRPVHNGYFIREVPEGKGGYIRTWCVEGGMGEVAKQLTALEANRAIECSISTPKKAYSGVDLSNLEPASSHLAAYGTALNGPLSKP